jgi:hypothetical protein
MPHPDQSVGYERRRAAGGRHANVSITERRPPREHASGLLRGRRMVGFGPAGKGDAEQAGCL